MFLLEVEKNNICYGSRFKVYFLLKNLKKFNRMLAKMCAGSIRLAKILQIWILKCSLEKKQTGTV